MTFGNWLQFCGWFGQVDLSDNLIRWPTRPIGCSWNVGIFEPITLQKRSICSTRCSGLRQIGSGLNKILFIYCCSLKKYLYAIRKGTRCLSQECDIEKKLGIVVN